MRHQNLHQSLLTYISLAGLPLLFGTLVNCGSQKEISVQDIGMTGLALSGPINTDFKLPRYAIGTYTNCVGHLNTDTWSQPINGYVNAAPMTDPNLGAIQIVKGDSDTNCILTVTQFLFEDTVASQSVTFNAAPGGLVIGNPSYSVSGVAFSDGLNADPDFYANAFRGSYANNFAITIEYSSDPRQVAVNKPAKYQAVSATVTMNQLAAPDYFPDFSGIDILVDASQNVATVSGNATFTLSGQAGQKYSIVTSIAGDQVSYDYQAVQNAFLSGSQTSFGGNLNLSANVPGSDNFLLNGVNLTGPGVVRYIIFENKDASANVSSYQIIKVTFTAATGF